MQSGCCQPFLNVESSAKKPVFKPRSLGAAAPRRFQSFSALRRACRQQRRDPFECFCSKSIVDSDYQCCVEQGTQHLEFKGHRVRYRLDCERRQSQDISITNFESRVSRKGRTQVRLLASRDFYRFADRFTSFRPDYSK